MREKHDDKRLDALRERLYARGQEPERASRVPLHDEKTEVPTAWESVAPPPPRNGSDTLSMSAKKQKYSYRFKILLTAVVFFVAAVMLSSLFIAFGGNAISGDNINITVNGPFTVGGGEEMPLQIGITNNNSVAIESATLIVEYPDGTQSVTEEGKQLFIDRIPLDSIGSGETVNVPLRARVFGEENEEHLVRVSVEYRVTGSNATFYKEADPLRFKIGSSPVSLDVDAVESLASGQEVDITLTIRSNASTPMSDLLVRADFPSGFDFTESSPSPVSGQNTWSIAALEPESSETITLKGVLLGGEEESRVMHFSVGVPNERDPLTLASVFSTVSKEFTIEQPFLDVDVTIDGSADLSVEPGASSNVQVTIKNTLDEAIYDGEIEVTLSGNALSDMSVRSAGGFYDSNTHTMVWDASSAQTLDHIGPGETEGFRFTVTPNTDAIRTPQINVAVSVRARRVRESEVSEALVGSARATIKVASTVTLRSETGHESGPTPPSVGEATIYNLSLTARGGSNDAAQTSVTATLPSYITWLDNASGDGTFSYSASSRTVTWEIGNIDANDTAEGSFEVSLLPSSSQIDTTPTLISEQHLRAEDRFTGTVIRANAPALTTGERVEAD